MSQVYEISELLEDPSHGEEEEPEEVPLSLKKLRDNLKRFRRNLQPLLDAGNWINGILHWSKPFETFIVFLVSVNNITSIDHYIMILYMYVALKVCILEYLTFLRISLENVGEADKMQPYRKY